VWLVVVIDFGFTFRGPFGGNMEKVMIPLLERYLGTLPTPDEATQQHKLEEREDTAQQIMMMLPGAFPPGTPVCISI
jgi:hypothetical protein